MEIPTGIVKGETINGSPAKTATDDIGGSSSKRLSPINDIVGNGDHSDKLNENKTIVNGTLSKSASENIDGSPSERSGPVNDIDNDNSERLNGSLKVLENVIRQQKDELDYYQRQLAINEHKHLTDLGNLQMQLQSVNKMYDAAKQEKETAFMRYVLKEKEILDLNMEKKKLVESLKDRDRQIIRLKVNSKEVANFTNLIETKNKEIKEYKAMVDLLKDEKTKVSKDLEHWKTKHEHDSKCSHETESKLLQEIQELQKKLESLTKENESFTEDSNLERIVLNSPLYLDLKECSEYQLQEIKKFKTIIEELNVKLIEHTRTVNCLENENIDLKTHMESCEIKTNELLVFTESLTSRNASLQSEYKNLQTTLDKLKVDCDVLRQKNIDLKIAFDVQKDDITKEKELYISDKKELASHLAQKMQMIAELKTTLECTRDDLHVSKHKFKTTVTELTKEVQKKNIVDTSVEMKMVLDKMVKLQQENAKICEKLDFVEDHNKQLLCELKRKSNIMQKHGITSKNGFVSDLYEQKPKRY